MRHARNFNPEWGYLAPAPSFVRTARAVLVAVAVGASGGAAVVFSLVDRPEAEESVAARTLALVPDTSPAISSPAMAATAPAAQLQAQEQRPAPQARANRELTGSAAAGPAPASAHAAGPAAVESGTLSTRQRPPGVAALAEAPAIVEGPPPQAPALAADETAATPAATPAAQKKPAKKSHFTALRNEQASRGPLALLRSFGTFPRGEY
jgi:hypothetical protein